MGLLNKGRGEAAAKSDFVEAEYGVPHCKYEKTPEGFKVNFNKTSLDAHKSLNTGANNSSKGLAQAIGSLIGLLIMGLFVAAKKAGAGTNIEVTRDAVIIDGKKMRREDFGAFNVARTWKGNTRESTLAVLGYTYGARSFEFGGAWQEGHANQVASSLNSHLRRAPMAGDEHTPSPEALRMARPTDF